METLQNWLLDHEPTLRLGAFAGVLALMITTETLWPKRTRVASRRTRWLSHGLITVVNTAALRLCVPLLAVGAALWAEEQNFGLFALIALPQWAAWLLSLLILDLAIYLQHRMFHLVPALWRIHRMHHCDVDVDASTALRFHPIEIVASMVYKMALVVLLGAPAGAVILFEITLNGMAVFNHANLALPFRTDKIMRAWIVTPDMHRVHHSAIPEETNSNFGFFLSAWDYLLGTYRAQPRAGHQGMRIGLNEFGDDARWQQAGALLLVPFVRLQPKEGTTP